jgi:hypothetical protein
VSPTKGTSRPTVEYEENRMKKLLSILFLSFSLGMSAQVHKGPHCGVELWAKKTLQDANAEEIGLIVPGAMDTTVEELVQFPAPTDLRTNPLRRHDPVERNRYRLHVLLKGFKLESDLDYHLVLESPNDPSVTMIGEIPIGKCSAKSIAQTVDRERVWLLKTFGIPAGRGKMLWLTPPQPIVVEGIGFFDFLHGQTGVAPNGVEIHPILAIGADGKLGR